MAHRNPNISKIVFFKNPKFWQTTLFVGGINVCEIQVGEKITADGRSFRKEL
jgi:energy-converting hydrogenase Eha subunit G